MGEQITHAIAEALNTLPRDVLSHIRAEALNTLPRDGLKHILAETVKSVRRDSLSDVRVFTDGAASQASFKGRGAKRPNRTSAAGRTRLYGIWLVGLGKWLGVKGWLTRPDASARNPALKGGSAAPRIFGPPAQKWDDKADSEAL